MPTRIVVLLLTLALAGCVGSSKQTPPPSPSATASRATASPPAGTPIVPTPIGNLTGLPSQADWTNCSGVYTTFVWPYNLGPGSHPTGWEPDSFASEVRTIIVECQRFGYGAMERGPIHFVVEYQNNFTPPPGCQADRGPIQYWLLNSLWSDDAEVATKLSRNEGIVTHAGRIEIASDQPSYSHRWAAWSTNGSASRADVYQEGPSTEQDSAWTSPARFYWLNSDDGASWMDFKIEGRFPSNGDRPVNGTMNPPMLMASLGGPYISTGGMLDQADLGGDFHRFKDTKCAAQS